MFCWSPNNNEEFRCHIPSAHKTSYPFINLDLGIYILFASADHPLYPKLTIKLFQWPLSGAECSCVCFRMVIRHIGSWSHPVSDPKIN